ncbi:uncharacterized protein HMPREF1541_08226 [Cyphellophora europaea CBS 101466]|uniref:Uncharacterized protein n=1 Tax=Cyphellophora europaea (strain CBS 101466) TaxID=1220924 RepID=W2RL62_CYPE1|nr:uncharacterized protein HMPREF1541_08226 [Cyphellophora europaea CBS 101466]ETN37236.1 hypothetical protein HMPREF1541_08226 [Cyphellophora europaea CBS 101466]
MADVEKTRAALRAKFDKITPEEFKNTAGNRDALYKLVVEKHGLSEEEAKKEVDAIFASA